MVSKPEKIAFARNLGTEARADTGYRYWIEFDGTAEAIALVVARASGYGWDVTDYASGCQLGTKIYETRKAAVAELEDLARKLYDAYIGPDAHISSKNAYKSICRKLDEVMAVRGDAR